MKYCDLCHSAYPDDFTTCPRDQGTLRPAADLPPGMLLRGKYEILEKLGSGGMASVYRAKHLAFGEVRAVKVVGAHLAQDESFLQRFRKEAVVTRKLQHPNAVRVDDLDATEDGRPFIVMEHVEGRNLRELIRREGSLPPRRALEIARQAASALGAAHALGITHRDVKPDNILVARGPDGSDVVKVLDFGIAKVREGSLETGEGYLPTQTGTVIGTPQYISPEQAMGKRGDEVDGRSDLYSLGIVLYEMVTGRLPFQSDTAMGMILHHLQTVPTPPQVARPDLRIPAPLSELLMRALQKDRERRFASAEEMVAAIDAVAAALPATPAGPAAVDTEAPTRVFPSPPQPSTPRPAPTAGAPDITTLPTRELPAGQPTPPATMVQRAPRRGRLWVPLAILASIFFVPALLLVRNNRDEPPRPRPPETRAPAASSELEEGEPGDELLRAEVQRVLSSSKATRDESIEVDVAEGVVTLSGTAGSKVAVQVAEALVETLPGVEKVQNRIRVRGATRLAPEASAAPPGVHAVPPAPPAPAVPGWIPFEFKAPAPDSPEGKAIAELLARGREALEQEDPDAALAAFGEAIVLSPANAEAQAGLRDAGRLLSQKARRPPRARPTPSPP